MALKSLSSLPSWQERRLLPSCELLVDHYCPDRCGHNAVCIKEELLVWGGYNEETGSKYCDHSMLWVYNVDMDHWGQYRVSGQHPPKRSGACSALIWPHWYIFLGHTSAGNVNDAYRLSLINLCWEQVSTSELQISPRDKATAWVYGNRIYCFGGFGLEPFTFLWDKKTDSFSEETYTRRGWNNQLLYLDTVDWHWVHVASRGQRPIPRAAHSSVCVDNCVYIFGGRHQAHRLNDLHSLCLDTHTWSGRIMCGGVQPEGRSWHSMSQVGKSYLLLVGGFDNNQQPLDDVWMLDLATFCWSLMISHTGRPRLWHTVCVSSQGDVLVFGGCVTNILDTSTTMITSDKVLLLRTYPFSLERLCLHTLYKHRDSTRSQWTTLPRPHQDWLQLKSWTESEFRPPVHKSCLEAVMGPDLSQLCVLSEKEANMLNTNR